LDGEFRWLAYFNSFYDAVDGVAPSTSMLQFRGDDGSVVEYEGPVEIVGRVSKRDSPAAAEVRFLSTLTDRTIKVTFPTASFLIIQVMLRSGTAVYESSEEAAEQIVGVLRELVDDSIAAGANYVQFDISGCHRG
jgi:methionine synthase II (cobalamin-independent)